MSSAWLMVCIHGANAPLACTRVHWSHQAAASNTRLYMGMEQTVACPVARGAHDACIMMQRGATLPLTWRDVICVRDAGSTGVSRGAPSTRPWRSTFGANMRGGKETGSGSLVWRE